MKFALHQGRFKQLFHQRNLFLGLACVLLFIMVIQSLALFFKSDHIVIMPPNIHRGFWVEKGQVSAAYMEEMASFFAHLILDITPKSAPYQRDILLRYVLPEDYGPLLTQLNLDAQRLAKENAATSFEVTEIKIMPPLTIHLWGDLVTFVGQKHISQRRQGFIITLGLKDGRVYLRSFKEFQETKEGNNP
jgi:conjugal transfer pilus assembly protein TraE